MSETAHTPTTVLQVLIDARALIERPENWCQRYLSKTADGCGQIGMPAHDAVSFCMNGAIFRAVGRDNQTSCEAIATVERITGATNIYFNDMHTHAEVLAAFDKAIEAERAKVSA